jgi:hypothetical protein
MKGYVHYYMRRRELYTRLQAAIKSDEVEPVRRIVEQIEHEAEEFGRVTGFHDNRMPAGA